MVLWKGRRDWISTAKLQSLHRIKSLSLPVLLSHDVAGFAAKLLTQVAQPVQELLLLVLEPEFEERAVPGGRESRSNEATDRLFHSPLARTLRAFATLSAKLHLQSHRDSRSLDKPF